MSTPSHRTDSIRQEQHSHPKYKELLPAAAATVTVAAGVIYVAGGVAYVSRLWAMNLPWALALSQLPRAPLQATAVAWLLIPTLIVSGLCCLAPLMLTRNAPRFSHPWLKLGYLTVLAIAATVPGALQWRASRRNFPELRTTPIWLDVLVLIAIIVFALAVSRAMLRFAERYIGSGHLLMAGIVVTSMGMLITLPGAMLFTASVPLPLVRACAAGYEVDARLINAASDWVYLAQYRYDDHVVKDRSIVLLPTTKVNGLRVAKNGRPACDANAGYLGDSATAR